ncbi:MAG: hypothetical protein QW162_03615 [Ignisphaera sp.]
MGNLINSIKIGLKHIPLFLALSIFYLYGFLWTVKPRRIKDMKDLLKVFYYDFLKLDEEDVEVVKIGDAELITISRNPCPILKLTQKLNMDTKYTCKLVSETVCKYVLKRINPDLVFERNYNHIIGLSTVPQ